MSNPTVVDIPHKLGREAAKARLAAGMGSLGDHIPGGVAEVLTEWTSPDRMALTVVAMGQRLMATLDVTDTLVRVSFTLPGMMGFMAGAIAAAVRREGDKLLLPKP
ncbi:MAG: hypothetical protein RL490_393 [Pseudomonadota bacterium]